MKIQINPRSLLNLEHICEVLYKLHPSVLNFLVKIERDLGPILGFIDMKNLTLEQKKILDRIYKGVDYLKEPEEPKELIKIKDKFKKTNIILVLIS